MGGSDEPVPVRVVLIGRTGCHLCDAARETVSRVAAELGVVEHVVEVLFAHLEERGRGEERVGAGLVGRAYSHHLRCADTLRV